MEFNGTTELAADREEAWTYFTDPKVLERCAPGCESMTMKSPSELEATLSVGVGSVKPTFDVDILVTDTDYPSTLGMSASGNASRNAFETAAEMVIEEVDGERAEVHWRATADVSGLLASIGQRALKSVTDRLVTQFFDDMEDLIQSGEITAESKFEEAETESQPREDPESA